MTTDTDIAALRETVGRAIAFHRLRDFGNALRWPAHKGDVIRDRNGCAAIEWHFAEACRAEADVVINTAVPIIAALVAERDAAVAERDRLREALERIASHDTELTREDSRFIAKGALRGGGLQDAWRPIEEWDGCDDLVFLLVDYTEGDHPLEDCTVGFTIGHNNDHNTPGQGVGWQFAGWCWSHDHFTEGRGAPIAWMPIPAGMLRARAALTNGGSNGPA